MKFRVEVLLEVCSQSQDLAKIQNFPELQGSFPENSLIIQVMRSSGDQGKSRFLTFSTIFGNFKNSDDPRNQFERQVNAYYARGLFRNRKYRIINQCGKGIEFSQI